MSWKRNKTVFYLKNNKSSKVKIAAFDFDHTLIKPKDGRVHPKSGDDIEFCFPNIKEKLSQLVEEGYELVIFSNQSSFDKPERQEIITSRMSTFVELVGVPITIYISTESDYCRKPNTGMWDEFYSGKDINLTESFYVGDAAGRIKNSQTKKRDFSCSDRMFASNIGIKFLTPEKFFQPEKYIEQEKFVMPKTWESFAKEQPPLDIEDYEVIVLIGPPGSGKSTISEDLDDFVLVSQDVLRYKAKCVKLMNETLKKGGKVVVDNTNPKRDKRHTYLEIAKKYSKKVLAVHIDITKEQSMFLVNYRCKKNKSKKVPDVAIHAYYKNLEKPIKGEGFDKVIERTFVPKGDLSLFQQYY